MDSATKEIENSKLSIFNWQLGMEEKPAEGAQNYFSIK